MDQIAQFIGKLNEQFQQNAGSAQLLVTLKQLEAVLLSQQPASRKELGTAKVAVVLPATAAAAPASNAAAPVAPELPALSNVAVTPEAPARQAAIFYDPETEIPTLAQQKANKELNEVMAPSATSLNDTLKTGQIEVGHILKETPVRDLRKAIGINDRFVFIKELFRGDENAYDRSIRTINSFRIFAEAEYWIERELKVKLGWDMQQDIPRYFYLLVKRRFS